jgi:hypothetical protein
LRIRLPYCTSDELRCHSGHVASAPKAPQTLRGQILGEANRNLALYAHLVHKLTRKCILLVFNPRFVYKGLACLLDSAQRISCQLAKSKN